MTTVCIRGAEYQIGELTVGQCIELVGVVEAVMHAPSSSVAYAAERAVRAIESITMCPSKALMDLTLPEALVVADEVLTVLATQNTAALGALVPHVTTIFDKWSRVFAQVRENLAKQA